MRARKAVVPAAGLGTRFLPATKAQPKEMLPLLDKPAIQYVIEEAAGAGLDDVLLITGRGKRALEDHFDHAIELERQLAAAGQEDLLAAVQAVNRLCHLHYVRQGQPLGLGHAVGCAARHVGDEAFAVLLGDDLIGEEEGLLQRMVDLCEASERSVLAVMEFPDEDLGKYGVVAGESDPDEPDVVHVHDMVEKPGKANAPSNLGIIGRYVLTPDIFGHIDRTKPGRGGEIQLTDAMKVQAQEEPIRAVRFDGLRYDIGNKMDYLRATVELAAQRSDLGPEFREFLTDFVKNLPDSGPSDDPDGGGAR
ncbi:UTP--glucose-1-phosphate uridylyltransferase GalU [Egibacter rhizosphaerae]|uniref:UTP--glucose-1-phosphate uridylyltransferase n=1 Tax=Egibacter rhizosphaerae TaxID=1670831 RepID=A0A411YIY7_9ACTN|nr:UTP--glucose-1-phosphate uridylyltransferase GalU [Egibacter rhizosphaerae]QBI21089.1 UTP--glucose-1-phosphate uridylyltransferase GalU [Egibacter rhizosphaerae]